MVGYKSEIRRYVNWIVNIAREYNIEDIYAHVNIKDEEAFLKFINEIAHGLSDNEIYEKIIEYFKQYGHKNIENYNIDSIKEEWLHYAKNSDSIFEYPEQSNVFYEIISDKLRFKKYTLPRPLSNVTIEGWDTETDKNGDIYLLANSHAYLDLRNWDIDKMLDFLIRDGEGKLNFFFNISFDFNAIMKPIVLTLDKDKRNEIRETRHIAYKEYEIEFIDNKYFKIKRKKHVVYFYDISQFYSTNQHFTLNYLSKKFLGKEKLEHEDFNKLKNEMTDDYIYNQAKYCMNDALLTKELSELLIKEISNVFEFTPRHYFSKAYLSEISVIMTGYDNPFRIMLKMYPREFVIDLMRYAYRSYKGGIFNTFVKGWIDGVEVDINSAYPHKIANLIDITKGNWKHVTEPHDNAHYGFYKVMRLYDGFSPYRTYEKLIIYPVTNKFLLLDYITKDELDYLVKNNVFVKVIDGYEYYPNYLDYPFKNLISDLFKKKDEYKKTNEIRYWLYKIIMNAIYGKFAQSKGSHYGKLFNPVYASYITAQTRLQITEIAKNYFDTIFYIATDSVCGIPKSQLPSSKELGAFEVKGKVEGILIQTGFIIDENGYPIKRRGIVKVDKPIDLNSSVLNVKFVKPLKLREAIVQDRVEEINKFVEIEKTIQIWDRKMRWGASENTKVKELLKKQLIGYPHSDDDIEAWA